MDHVFVLIFMSSYLMVLIVLVLIYVVMVNCSNCSVMMVIEMMEMVVRVVVEFRINIHVLGVELIHHLFVFIRG